MLVLGRNLNESIVIGDNIFIKIVKGKHGDLKVAIDAPREIPITRGELFDGIEEVERRWAKALRD